MKKLLFLLPVALLLGFIIKAPSLKLNLNKGKIYTQESQIESNIVQSQQGQEIAITSKIMSTINTQVVDEGKEEDKLSMWYVSISSSTSSPYGSMSFSSDTTEMTTVDETSKIFAGLTGKAFTLTVNNQGRVSNVKGLSEIFDTLSSGAASQMEKDQIKAQLSSNFGNESLAGNLENTLAIFPDKNVKIGDTWNNEVVTSGELPTVSKNTYTLKSIDADKATITLTAKVISDPDNSSKELQGMKAQYFLEGDRTGTLIIDLKSGWLLNGQFVDEIAGSINILPNAQVPDGMNIPLTVTSNTTITGTIK